MRFHEPDAPVYIISVASRLLGVSPRMLRMLDHEGLLEPARTEKNIRLYSQNDLMLLERICRLIVEEHVNIAGVKAILRIERARGSLAYYERGAEQRGGEAEDESADDAPGSSQEDRFSRRR